jgi:hypothetical protein
MAFCPSCLGKIRVPALTEAKQVKCGHCRHSFRLEPTEIIIDVFSDLNDKDDALTELARCGGCNGRLRIPRLEMQIFAQCGHCHQQVIIDPSSSDGFDRVLKVIPKPTAQASSAVSTSDTAAFVEASTRTDIPQTAEVQAQAPPASTKADPDFWFVNWERLIRWPLSFVLAIFSFYLLSPYTENNFWVLVAVHTTVASLLGTAVVFFIGRRLFLFWDEMVGRSFLFLSILFFAHLGGTGWTFITPVFPFVAAPAAPIIAWQNQLLGVNGVPAAGPVAGQVSLFAGISDLLQEWGYAMDRDSSWDNEPMTSEELRNKSDMSFVKPELIKGKVMLVTTVSNGGNQILLGMKAGVDLGVATNKPYSLGTLHFISDKPLLPGHSGKMYASISTDHLSKTVIKRGSSVNWSITGSQSLNMFSFDTKPFNRVDYFERNVDQWLTE